MVTTTLTTFDCDCSYLGLATTSDCHYEFLQMLSGNIEGDIDQNLKTLHACWLAKGRINNVTGTAKGINLKLSGHAEGDIEK